MSAGVYRFAHEASGLVYVGASMDLEQREVHWRVVLDWLAGRPIPRGFRPQASLKVRLAVRRVGADGWKLSVVWRLPPDASEPGELLWQHEREAIEAAIADCGDRCLNRVYPGEGRFRFGPRPSYLRSSKIVSNRR